MHQFTADTSQTATTSSSFKPTNVDSKVYNPNEKMPFEREVDYVGDPARVHNAYSDVLKKLRAKTNKSQ